MHACAGLHCVIFCSDPFYSSAPPHQQSTILHCGCRCAISLRFACFYIHVSCAGMMLKGLQRVMSVPGVFALTNPRWQQGHCLRGQFPANTSVFQLSGLPFALMESGRITRAVPADQVAACYIVTSAPARLTAIRTKNGSTRNLHQPGASESDI
jgi:hypothetical protein